MRLVWILLVSALICVNGSQNAKSGGVEFGTNDDELHNHKTSISIDTRRGAPQPYFATFDSTNVAYHWETNMIDDAQLKKMLPIINADDLSKEALESLLAKSKIEETEAVTLEEEKVNPREIFAKSSVFEEAGPQNIGNFLRKAQPFVMILLCDCERDERVARAVPELEEMVKQASYHDFYSFLYLYPAAIQGFQLLAVFDMVSGDLPAFVIDNIPVGANMEKYRYDKLLSSSPESKFTTSAEGLFRFVQGFQHRTLQMIVRSAPVPKDHHNFVPGTVKEVVATTFESVVLDTTKNVFLLVYSPRCSGSMAVQPVFQQVAHELAGDSDLLIARMDGTQNDFPVRGLSLSHYPSAFFFPRGSVRKDDGSLNFLNWDDYNGSKTPHNSNVPVISYFFI